MSVVMVKVKRFKSGQRYRFTKNWESLAPPLRWYAQKGDIVIFNCKGFSNTARFYAVEDNRLILISVKEAFEIIEEE